MFNLNDFCFSGSSQFDIFNSCTDAGIYVDEKKQFLKKTKKNLEAFYELQEKLYSQSKEAVLICIQALDAAGKDSLIKHVLSGVNPEGLIIYNYRTPTVEEASHDFLWRYHKNLPSRGKIAVFNRSYYEEVLVVKVHEDYKNYNVPARMLRGDYIGQKYKDICAWEKYLYGNGTKIVKIFLNVSKETQKERFLERIERPEKNWKFSANDIKERDYFEKYQQAFQDAINHTATKSCPWYVLPADKKWFTRFLFSEVLLKTLQDIKPCFPVLKPEQMQSLEECRERLS